MNREQQVTKSAYASQLTRCVPKSAAILTQLVCYQGRHVITAVISDFISCGLCRSVSQTSVNCERVSGSPVHKTTDATRHLFMSRSGWREYIFEMWFEDYLCGDSVKMINEE